MYMSRSSKQMAQQKSSSQKGSPARKTPEKLMQVEEVEE